LSYHFYYPSIQKGMILTQVGQFSFVDVGHFITGANRMAMVITIDI